MLLFTYSQFIREIIIEQKVFSWIKNVLKLIFFKFQLNIIIKVILHDFFYMHFYHILKTIQDPKENWYNVTYLLSFINVPCNPDFTFAYPTVSWKKSLRYLFMYEVLRGHSTTLLDSQLLPCAQRLLSSSKKLYLNMLSVWLPLLNHKQIPVLCPHAHVVDYNPSVQHIKKSFLLKFFCLHPKQEENLRNPVFRFHTSPPLRITMGPMCSPRIEKRKTRLIFAFPS